MGKCVLRGSVLVAAVVLLFALVSAGHVRKSFAGDVKTYVGAACKVAVDTFPSNTYDSGSLSHAGASPKWLDAICPLVRDNTTVRYPAGIRISVHDGNDALAIYCTAISKVSNSTFYVSHGTLDNLPNSNTGGVQFVWLPANVGSSTWNYGSAIICKLPEYGTSGASSINVFGAEEY